MADVTVGTQDESEALRTRVAELEAALAAERQRVATLRESESIYRKLIDTSPDAIYVHDDKRRIVFINPAGVRLFAAESPEQLIGALTTTLVHPESRHLVNQHIDRVLSRNTTSVQLEQRRVRLDGTDFYADVLVSAITWNERAAGLVVVRDVTERMLTRERAARAEEELQAAHARLIDAIEAMPGGFALFDEQDRLVTYNSYYANTMWPQRADIVRPGMTFQALVEESLRYSVWDSVRGSPEAHADAALARHRNLPSENEVQYADGRWFL
jgi:PAS domain S-box-containing protein